VFKNGIATDVISIDGRLADSTNHSLIPNEEGNLIINLFCLLGS
jgi:hypothetical protein